MLGSDHPPVRPKLRRPSGWLVLVGVAATGMAVWGCAGTAPGKVTGIVRLNGTPLADAGVQLRPKEDPGVLAYAATTGPDGRFQIATPDGKPVKPGRYVVLVTKLVKKDGTLPKEDDPPRELAPGALRSVIPELYGDENRSPLVVEIQEGNNDLPPFDLNSGPKRTSIHPGR